MLSARVLAGQLPTVVERLPDSPLVVVAVDTIGQ
jgi:hypothetical protein